MGKYGWRNNSLVAKDITLDGSLIIKGDLNFGDASADTITVSGTSTFNAPVTVGVNDTGYDVKFFGATSGAYMLWDESADDLILAGAAGLSVAGTSSFTGKITADDIDLASGAIVAGLGTGANGIVLKNLKNAAASSLSGTQLDVEIDIGGTAYYFTVYPTKA